MTKPPPPQKFDGGSTPKPRDAIDLFGLRVDRVTEQEIVEHVISSVTHGDGGWIVTPNAHHLRAFKQSPNVQLLISQADWLIADGMPLVWASRLQCTPLPERVAGSNLVWSLTEAAADNNISIFLLGGDEGVADRATGAFKQRFPSLQVAGVYSPPRGFEDDPDATQEIEDALVHSRPDIVYVALGFPKQERLIVRLRQVLPKAWFLGIGISLSFVSGDIPRAPPWMRRLGLEWLHRLMVEPTRLFRRYVIQGIPFVMVMLVKSASIGLHRILRGQAKLY